MLGAWVLLLSAIGVEVASTAALPRTQSCSRAAPADRCTAFDPGSNSHTPNRADSSASACTGRPSAYDGGGAGRGPRRVSRRRRAVRLQPAAATIAAAASSPVTKVIVLRNRRFGREP